MPDTIPPRCSVVIPAYNAADFVVQAVESARGQTPDTPQVIVVDDGSTDDTARLVEGIPGVTLIRQANGGRSAARMAGFTRTATEFVIFLDADDELTPGAVTAHLVGMAAAPRAAMVFGSNLRIDKMGRETGLYTQTPFETGDPHLVAYQVTPTPSQCMYRHAAVAASGGFDVARDLCEDPDLNIRIVAQGTIACHGALVARYRMHDGQSTKRPSKICRAHLDVIRTHLGPGGAFADPAALNRCMKKWKRYYGQNMPVEIMRTALRRDFPGSGAALRTFASCLPYSAVGAVTHVPTLLKKRFT
jgi:glycosyltransferase involved in cell wall biosynthesis